MRRHRRLPLPAALLGLVWSLLGPQPILAQDWDAAEQLQGVVALTEGGYPFYDQFFRMGWPTSAGHQRLTRELCAEPAAQLISAYLASGAGLPVSASSLHLQEAAGQRGATPIRVLRNKLADFKSRSGFQGNLPPDLDPVLAPYALSRASLRKPWNPAEVVSWTWVAPPKREFTLEAYASALLAEATFASDELPESEGDTLGSTPQRGFFALVGLHAALAKTQELRELLYDEQLGAIVAGKVLRDADEYRFWLPPRWSSQLAEQALRHTFPAGSDPTSELRGQAILLLGLCRLAQLCSPGAPEPVRRLFHGSKRLFPSESFDMVLESALFVFRSVRTKHYNVKKGKAVSRFQGEAIATSDLSLLLQAIRSFLQDVSYPTPARGRKVEGKHVKSLREEQEKAVLLLNTLTRRSLLVWQKQDPGFYERYLIKNNNSAQGTRKTLEAQGMGLQGLLAAYHGLEGRGHADTRALALEAIATSFRWLDAARWNTRSLAYNEGNSDKVSLRAAVAVLTSLRGMALTSGDGRYLMRYRQYLTAMHQGGMFQEAKGNRPPTLQSEFTLPK